MEGPHRREYLQGVQGDTTGEPLQPPRCHPGYAGINGAVGVQFAKLSDAVHMEMQLFLRCHDIGKLVYAPV